MSDLAFADVGDTNAVSREGEVAILLIIPVDAMAIAWEIEQDRACNFATNILCRILAIGARNRFIGYSLKAPLGHSRVPVIRY